MTIIDVSGIITKLSSIGTSHRILLNTWHHVACSYDRKLGILALWINGKVANNRSGLQIDWHDTTTVLSIGRSMKTQKYNLTVFSNCQIARFVSLDQILTTAYSNLVNYLAYSLRD